MTFDELKNKKVGFISLGCDKNRVDLENIIYKFKKRRKGVLYLIIILFSFLLKSV